MDTVHECDRRTDRRTDGQNYDHKDGATQSVAVGPYSTSLYWSVIRANVLDSEHNQTHATAHLRSSIYFSSLRRLQLMSIAVLDVFCLVVCVNLWPKTVVSHGEQNRYGWRRLTLLTARLIKFYGGLRLMKSTAAYGGG